MLDPVKEITAEVLACENGFSTRAESTMRLNGTEYHRNVQELKTENEQLVEAISVTQVAKEAIKDSIKTEDRDESSNQTE